MTSFFVSTPCRASRRISLAAVAASLALASLAHAENWVGYYEIRQDGRLIGAERIDFDDAADGSYTVRTNGTLKQGEGKDETTFSNLSELRARAGGEFQDYQREVTVNKLPRKLAMQYDGYRFVVQVAVGKGAQEYKIPAPSTSVVTDLGIYGHLQLLVRTAIRDSRLGREIPIVNPGELTKATAVVDDRGADSVKTAKGYFASRRLFVDMGSVGANVWTDTPGRMIRAEIPAIGVTVELQNFTGPRATEAAPLRAKSERVDRADAPFPIKPRPGSDDTAMLHGVVRRPRGVTGRLPAVIFLSDVGPQSADGVDPVTKLDTRTGDLCDAIAEGGFAVMSWDDRGVDRSPGDVAQTTLDTQVADARAALRWLVARDDIDPARVALVSLGEGGNVAWRVAAAEPGVKAVVALAPAPVSMAKLAEEQARRRLSAAADFEAEDLDEHPVMVALKKARTTNEEFTVIGNRPTYLDVFRQWDRLDPAADLAAVKVPVLQVLMGRDEQVFPELSDAFVKKAGSKSNYTVKRFDALDHFLVRGRGTIGSYSDPDRRIDPEAVAYIVRWLSTGM